MWTDGGNLSREAGRAAWALALVIACTSSAALADEPPTPPTPAKETPGTPPEASRVDPKADPSLNVPGVTRVLEEQQQRPEPAAPIAPIGAGSSTPALPAAPTVGPGSIPGLSLNSVALPRRKVYPEGTFLQGIGGSIVRAAGGESIFVPDGSPGSRREPPMVLMQCAALARLEGSSESSAGAVLSGQFFVYMGRQYLLPTNFTLRRITADVPAAPVSPAAETESKAANSPTASAADVAELIQELDARRSEKRQLQPAREPTGNDTAKGQKSEVATGEPKDAPVGLVNEGTLIHDRRARFARIDGEPAITFDGDAQNPADPPMLVLRCRSLQRLEETIAKRGENLTLSVSGRVMVYAGRNYILPTLVQIEPGSDVRPLQ
jgi:hypothetical protein